MDKKRSYESLGEFNNYIKNSLKICAVLLVPVIFIFIYLYLKTPEYVPGQTRKNISLQLKKEFGFIVNPNSILVLNGINRKTSKKLVYFLGKKSENEKRDLFYTHTYISSKGIPLKSKKPQNISRTKTIDESVFLINEKYLVYLNSHKTINFFKHENLLDKNLIKNPDEFKLYSLTLNMKVKKVVLKLKKEKLLFRMISKKGIKEGFINLKDLVVSPEKFGILTYVKREKKKNIFVKTILKVEKSLTKPIKKIINN
jgi:uncharacterized protein YneR